MKLKTLLFGGAFDPPHKSHFDTASAALRYEELKNFPVELWFVPCHSNEFGHEELTSIEHREAMLSRIITHLPKTRMYVDKLSNDGIYATIVRLINKYPEREFYYVMGADQAIKIRGWRNSRNLLKTIPFIVIAKSYFTKLVLFDWCFNHPHIFINFPNVTHLKKDASHRSSDIRSIYRNNWKQKNKNKPEGVTYDTHKYILKNNLYQ